MTFLSPNVGGHQQPLISGHSFAPSQKGHQQNCQGICLNKKPRRNHTASPGSAVWDPGFSEASFAQDFSGSFQALREQLRTLLTPLFARVVICCYHIFVHSFFWHRLNIVLKYWILSTSQRNVPTPTKNLRMDCAFEMTRSHPGILAQGLAFSAQQKSQVLSGVPNHGRCMFRSPAVGVRPWQIWGAVALRHWVRCSPVTSEWDTGKRCCRFWSWCLKDRDDWLRLLIGGLMIMVNWLTA